MSATTKRPIIVSVATLIGIIWSIGNFVFVFSPFIKKISQWAPAIYGLLVAFQFIAFIGTWYMKRWGVLLFICTTIAKVVFSLLIDDVNYIGVGLSVILIILFLIFYKKMGDEL